VKGLGRRCCWVWFALLCSVAQAALPTLRIATTSTGQLRAEVVLANARCAKPAVGIADGMAALLNPWLSVSAQSKYHHCDSCIQHVDVPLPLASDDRHFFAASATTAALDAAPSKSVASAFRFIPPSRGPPHFS
jgi:hypothetical protein